VGNDPPRRAPGVRLTTLRILRTRGMVQPTDYTRGRRQLAAARRAAFLVPPDAPNQVWQLDFSEFDTSCGGTWRIAGCADYWSKYEFGWHISPTANQRDAVAAVELAIAEAETLAGALLLESVTDQTSGQIRPVVIVTDNGGPFKSDRFARFIDSRPELTHIRTKIKSSGQNGLRERAFGTLKYEHLYRGDHRRRLAGPAHRAVPHRVQHRATPRSAGLEPAHRRPPRPRRPRHRQL